MTKLLEVIKVQDIAPAIQEALPVLAGGGLVVFPTDTVYGLGAHPLIQQAVSKVFEAKGRPEEKALPLLLSDISQMELAARDISDAARRLAERFFPGALTIVLFKSGAIPDWVTGGDVKLAIRVPDHAIPRALARSLGFPITGTSANKSGLPPACSAQEALQQLGDRVDLILDGGPCQGGIPSTVVDVTTLPVTILRQGVVSKLDIERALESR